MVRAGQESAIVNKTVAEVASSYAQQGFKALDRSHSKGTRAAPRSRLVSVGEEICECDMMAGGSRNRDFPRKGIHLFEASVGSSQDFRELREHLFPRY